MPFETLLSKVIKRRKPEREKSDGKGIDGKGEKRQGLAASASERTEIESNERNGRAHTRENFKHE